MIKIKNKKITIDNLAVMVNTGFNNQMEYMEKNFITKKDSENFATKNDLEKLEKKIDGIATKEDIKNLSKQISGLSEYLKKNNNIEMRVDYIENVLAIKQD